jgi:effector-binding domain-containing protein
METGTSIAPQLQTGCAQPYVAVPVDIFPIEEKQLRLIILELTGWLNQNGVNVAGPLFFRYYICGDLDNLRCAEVGYPVSAEVKGNNRIVTGKIPKGIYATLTHCGQPGRISTVLETMQQWAKQQGKQWKFELQNGKRVWSGFFEFYLTDPAIVYDNSPCRTALAILTDEQTSG